MSMSMKFVQVSVFDYLFMYYSLHQYAEKISTF